eukprot:COSAG01_NODE_44215_length_421_cov_1.121118_1_plen_45_part_10
MVLHPVPLHRGDARDIFHTRHMRPARLYHLLEAPLTTGRGRAGRV